MMVGKAMQQILHYERAHNLRQACLPKSERPSMVRQPATGGRRCSHSRKVTFKLPTEEAAEGDVGDLGKDVEVDWDLSDLDNDGDIFYECLEDTFYDVEEPNDVDC